MRNDPDALTDDPRDPEGNGPRLKDEYLLAFIIAAEFHIYVQNEEPIYPLALAALYSEYKSSYICGGNCNSVRKQITWLTTLEGWYSVANPDSLLL
jgi:hypothetical protein